MKLGRIAMVVALSVGVGVASLAHAYLFDPDGAGGAAAVNINSFDWLPSTFAAVGGASAIAAFQANPGCAETSCNFEVYTHAVLGVIRDTNNNVVNLPAGEEITMVAHVTERVTDLLPLDGTTWKLVKSVSERRDGGEEEAVFGATDHRVLEGSGSRYGSEGSVS